MSGEWHTGEVVSLCESYGFIRKDGARPDIFMHYDDVEGFEPQIGDRVSFGAARAGGGGGRPAAEDYHQAALDASMADEVKG